MNFRIIDSHAHVQFPAYDQDRDNVIGRALAAGIGMVNVGTQYATSFDAIRLAEQYPAGVWATAGFHPGHLDANAHHDPRELKERNAEHFDYAKFLDLARQPKVVAVGECGLDYFRSGIETKEAQREIFEQQIALAHEVGKPLVIHCRQAFADLIAILDSKFQILNSPAGVV
ncbi:MAG: TatD family hydrolase, partial [bacterium]|nr:TatD family hydrolase [bacterium]